MKQSVKSINPAAACLAESDPTIKCRCVAELKRDGTFYQGDPINLAPGRPERPTLVDPRNLPKRKLSTAKGHAAFVHAICHIEFTAINLALDAVVRFSGMPTQYYADWIGVAIEEAKHFSLLDAHLKSLGFAYGDFAAHDGLWDMAERTSDDVLRRMALIPRVMEARGLDVTPNMLVRLESIGDHQGGSILNTILRDEIGHVAIGSRWFASICASRGLDSLTTFGRIIAAELGQIRASRLNRSARLAAGFSNAELELLLDPAKRKQS